MTSNTAKKGLPRHRLIALIAPAMITDLATIVIGFVIPGYYAKVTPLSLGIIGTVILLAKLFDAVSDPLMGYLSDKIETRFGRRKPWLPLGAVLFAFGHYLLLTPSADATVTYFAISWILLYFGYTVFAVPYSAWQLELVRDYDERQRIVTYRTIASFTGAVLFVLAPLVMSRTTGSTEFTPEVLKLIAIFVAIFLPLLTAIALIVAPRETRLSHTTPRFLDVWRVVAENRPFQVFALAYLIWGFGAGAWTKLTYIFVDSYLGIAEYFALIMGVTFITRLIALPVWSHLLKTKEKSSIWAFSLLGTACVLPLYWFVPIGPEAIKWVIGFTILIGLLDAAVMLLPLSFIGDIADFDTYKTGNDRTATFKAALALMNKVFMAVGGGIALISIDLMGFDVKVANTEFALQGFKFTAIIVPALCFAGAAWVIRRHPLGREKHALIMKDIEERKSGGQSKNPQAPA